MTDYNDKLQLIEPRVKTYWVAVLIGLPLCVMTMMLWGFLNNQKKLDIRKLVDIEAQKLSVFIRKDMDNRVRSINRMNSRWQIHHGIPKNEFSLDSLNYISDMPGFQAIEWVDKNFNVRWIVPLAGNEQVLNMNLAFEEKRRIALERAKFKREPTITPPIDLIQGGKGFLIYFPIYIGENFEGFIVAALKISDWLDYVFGAGENPEQFEHFRILIYFDDIPVYRQIGWEDYEYLDLDVIHTFVIRGYHFHIHCRPTTHFIEIHNNMLPEFAAAFGLLMSFMVSFAVILFLKSGNETWKTNIIKRDLEIEIQERKNVEASLQETSARLALATKAGKVGIWSWYISANTLIWDDIMFELYDVHPDEHPDFDTWRYALHPDDRERAVALVTEASIGKAQFDTEFRICLRDGSIRYIHAAGKLVRDHHGTPSHMIGVNWDISDLKTAEAGLKIQTEMQKILMHISSKYINMPLNEMDRGILTALAEIGKYVHADRIEVFDYDFETHTLSVRHEWRNQDIEPMIESLQNVSLDRYSDWVNIHMKGKPMQVLDVSALSDGLQKDILSGQGVKTLVAFPMENASELMGFVSFEWVTDHYTYSDSECDLLNLFSQILVNITLRKLSEKTLLESRNRLDLALKGTKAGIWDWYIQTGEIVLNERWAEIAGYSLNDLEPIHIDTWINLYHPDDFGQAEKMMKNHFDGLTEFFEHEARMKHKNGQWIWVLDRGQVVAWDYQNQPLRMTGTHIDITERKMAEEKIRHMANHDALTDLPTLRLAKDRANYTLQQSIRYKTKFALMFIDLDGFKEINDSFGHEIGDALLKELSRRFLSSVRHTDTVARFGGDEFLVIVSELFSAEDAANIAGKLISVASQPFRINGTQMAVGASIGISVYPDDGEEIDLLIRKADMAMYRIKRLGKNGYAFANSESDEYPDE